MQIVEIKEVRASYVERVNELLSQLAPSLPSFTGDDLEEIVTSPYSHLFFLYDRDIIAGMLTIGSYKAPTGSKYWIEDVVVDDVFRGKGLGKILVEYAVGYVRERKAASLMLTSNPQRVAANSLYRSVGFEQIHTNV